MDKNPSFNARPVVQPTALKSATPWLSEELKRVAELRSLAARWESSGADPPNETAIQLALQVVQSLSEIDLRPDHIDPSTDEGVCISFRRRERYADIECFNSGEMLAALSADGGTPQIWDVPPSEVAHALATISSFIRD